LYIVRSGDPAARTQGVKHITWGIVGLVVMLSAYTIMSIFAGTFGLGDDLERANDGEVVNPLPTNNNGGAVPPTGNNNGSVNPSGSNNNGSAQPGGTFFPTGSQI